MSNDHKNRIRVLVTGSYGQLGRCIDLASHKYTNLEFIHKNSKELDITDIHKIDILFERNNFDYVINCAAYTNVEQAEKDPKKAFLVNAEGVKNLAKACKKNTVILVHVSTDYVFDGEKKTPYTEEDVPNPINEYGKSKLAGEQYVQNILDNYFIIRTSWLYSQFGTNFYKTILKKSEIEKELTITTAEIGTPTNANDLANFILEIIAIRNAKYGLYHFSNGGQATWYDFAEEIIKLTKKGNSIKLEKTDNYPTFAFRPKFSVLSKALLKKKFNQNVLDWKGSLKVTMIKSIIK